MSDILVRLSNITSDERNPYTRATAVAAQAEIMRLQERAKLAHDEHQRELARLTAALEAKERELGEARADAGAWQERFMRVSEHVALLQTSPAEARLAKACEALKKARAQIEYEASGLEVLRDMMKKLSLGTGVFKATDMLCRNSDTIAAIDATLQEIGENNG